MRKKLLEKTYKSKAIMHMDGDAFFVGCEIAKNPKLKGLPVVTGEERGIVSALSYEAKALGIIRGMPIFRVKKDFPSVLVLPGDYKSYAEYSSKMFAIVRRYANDVEEYSIDECFADLTGLHLPLKMSYLEIAQRIKREIDAELGVSVSIGVAPTKVLAKVASNWVKPNGLTIIEQSTISNFLPKVPIGKIWGIGRQTSQFLISKGVHTAGDFAAKEGAWVQQALSKPYETIWQELHGMYVMEIDREPKLAYSSIQKTRTFHPATNDKNFLLSEFSKHIEDACRKARYYALFPKKFSFFLKTQDFKYMTCMVTLATPTNTPEALILLIEERLHEIHKRGVKYRTAGVTLQNLFTKTVIQEDLFGGATQAKKYEIIYKNIDALEEKFGKRMVYLGSTHKSMTRKKVGTDTEDLSRDLLFL